MMRKEANTTLISLVEATKKCLDNNFSSVEEKNNCVEIFMNHGNLESKITFIIGMKSDERTIPFLEDLSNENKILIFKQIQVELVELSKLNIRLCQNEESQIMAKKKLLSQLIEKDEVILKLRQELKERDEKISNQERKLREQDEKILSQDQELKKRDEKILSQKQVSQTIRSSFFDAPMPMEPPITVSADIVQDGSGSEVEVRPSSALFSPIINESAKLEEPNIKKTNCFSVSRCVTM